MSKIEFIKMHALGNDFVVFDARANPIKLDNKMVRTIANRRTENASNQLAIETIAGLLPATRVKTGITVNMGKAYDNWKDIPLVMEADTLHLDLSEGILSDPVCVNIGNPHTVFFVNDVEIIPLNDLGPKLENNSWFPERTNVEVVQVIGGNYLKVRVWERGAGITQACGTGACAALVAGFRRGLTGREAQVDLDGGVLEIQWQENNTVLMTGPTATSYAGTWQG